MGKECVIFPIRIIAGIGMIGAHAMPGGDHHNCVFPSLVFPLFWL